MDMKSMIAAICGDIVGRNYECSMWSGANLFDATCIGYDRDPWWNDRTGEKAATMNLFDVDTSPTDDSHLTIVVAKWLLDGGDLRAMIQDEVCEHPNVGWGAYLKKWALSRSPEPCGSFGNGAAMRVSPVGFVAGTFPTVIEIAETTAIVTHTVDHAVDGAKAVAFATLLARLQMNKDVIQHLVGDRFGYDLRTPLDSIREGYKFSSQCPESVPQAICAFLESQTFEETIRRAISIGGDADTIASMAAAIAGAQWGVPAKFYDFAMDMIPAHWRSVIERFDMRYCN